MPKERVILRAVRWGLGTCMAGLLWTTGANATLMIQEGVVGGSGDVQNVLLTGPITTGIMVQGETNQSHDIVDFTGSEELTIATGGGQDRIVDSAGDGFDNVTINLDNPLLGFAKVQFAVDWLVNGTSTGNNTGGEATISATDQFGNVFSQTFSVDTTGQQFYTIFSNDNQVGVLVTIVANPLVKMTGIDQLQEVRIDPTDRVVPEPATIAMLGSGLIGLGLLIRTRRPRA